MASQWRIRHKLMLGLILVVGAMALLLGGTLRGLWMYYNTMNAIRGKMVELDAARALQKVVNELIDSANLNRLTHNQQDLVWIENDWSLKAVDAALKAFREQIDENRDNGRDSGDNEHELELIDKVLPENLTLLKKLIHAKQGEVKDSDNDKESPVNQTAKILANDARDLQDTIKKKQDECLSESRRHYQVALWVTLPASIIGMLLTIGLMRSFYSWIFNPIRDLEAGVRRVALGDFTRRIEVHSGDEMEDLGGAFNEMMQRLQDLYTDLARQVNERSRQLVRSEKLASVGFLAAGVAHEINNPLASIAFCSEALEARLKELLRSGRRTDDAEVFTKYLKMIQEEAFRCKNITERLLAFSRTSERRREMTDVGQLIQGVLDITSHLPNARGKQIDFLIMPDRAGSAKVLAPVNAEEIKSVVLNLVVNALDSMNEGGVLTIRLSQKNGMCELRFTDTGCGMTQEVLENIFEPFFTRSRTGKGTGLGLTISHGIITQHGGEIEATSPGPDQGSTFTVRLPLQIAEAPPAPAEVRKPLRGMAA